jgi:Flp pilus assembly protein TadD
LVLMGVITDIEGRHAQAQTYYREGLQVAPNDPGLTVDLALSLALGGDYTAAVGVLRPLATAPGGTPQERQTLALIYGLQGSLAEATRLGRIDLDEAAVDHNLAYYRTLRELAPEARDRAIWSASLPPASKSP